MYDRDKTISREWYDPVGWAGLDKVSPRAEELDVILKRQADIETRCVHLRSEILEKGSRLRALGIEADATRDRSHLRKLHETQTGHLEELSKAVEKMRAELSNDEVLHESLGDHAERLRNGERPPRPRPYSARDAPRLRGRDPRRPGGAAVGIDQRGGSAPDAHRHLRLSETAPAFRARLCDRRVRVR
jgi:hypothetical protein